MELQWLDISYRINIFDIVYIMVTLGYSFKGCVRYIFASLFFMTKREHL